MHELKKSWYCEKLKRQYRDLLNKCNTILLHHNYKPLKRNLASRHNYYCNRLIARTLLINYQLLSIMFLEVQLIILKIM